MSKEIKMQMLSNMIMGNSNMKKKRKHEFRMRLTINGKLISKIVKRNEKDVEATFSNFYL